MLFIFPFCIFRISTFVFCILSGHVCCKMAETTSSLQGAKPRGTCWASCASLEMIISDFCNSHFVFLCFNVCVVYFDVLHFCILKRLPATMEQNHRLPVRRPTSRASREDDYLRLALLIMQRVVLRSRKMMMVVVMMVLVVMVTVSPCYM